MTAAQPVESVWQDDWSDGLRWRPDEDRTAPVRPPPRRFPSGPADIAHILHIEPQRSARRILRITLGHPRIYLTQVESGEAAINLLAIKPYDLVLMSLDLSARTSAGMGASAVAAQAMNATETLAWIRSSVTPWSDTPVIGLRDGRAGNRGGDRIGELMARGLTDWILRPVSRQTINDKLIALLPALYDAGL